MHHQVARNIGHVDHDIAGGNKVKVGVILGRQADRAGFGAHDMTVHFGARPQRGIGSERPFRIVEEQDMAAGIERHRHALSESGAVEDEDVGLCARTGPGLQRQLGHVRAGEIEHQTAGAEHPDGAARVQLGQAQIAGRLKIGGQGRVGIATQGQAGCINDQRHGFSSDRSARQDVDRGPGTEGRPFVATMDAARNIERQPLSTFQVGLLALRIEPGIGNKVQPAIKGGDAGGRPCGTDPADLQVLTGQGQVEKAAGQRIHATARFGQADIECRAGLARDVRPAQVH